MVVGVPKEIKTQENRVGITPAGVHALASAGHKVIVEKGAGLGSMITDEEYVSAGAVIGSQKDCWRLPGLSHPAAGWWMWGVIMAGSPYSLWNGGYVRGL